MQRVVVEGVLSDASPVVSGVPQGSELGPCLFLFYINDIAVGLQSTVRLFADDTMLYLTIKNDQDAQSLQHDLDLLCEREAIEFHPDKCEVISVTRKKHPTLQMYYIHGHQLKYVDHVRYLGVNITSDLRWDKHVDIICNKANSALGFIRRNVNIGNATVKTRAYKCYVCPVLEHSSTVWDPYTVSPTRKLESVQRRAARYTLGRLV